MIHMDFVSDINSTIKKLADATTSQVRPKYYAPQWFFDEFGSRIPDGFEKVVLPDRFECEGV